MEIKNRILSLELSGVKNIEYGKISFPEASYALSGKACKKSGILGLYGPNGTGKTALVDTFYILKAFSLERQLVYQNSKGETEIDPVLRNYICAWGKEAKASFQFLVTLDTIPYAVSFSFSFAKGKDDIPILSKEKIQVFKPNPKGDGYVQYGKAWAINYSDTAQSAIGLFDFLDPSLNNLKDMRGAMAKITSCAMEIQASGSACKSYFLSEAFFTQAKACLKESRLHQANIIHALFEQISYGLFVYTMNEGAIQTLGTNVFFGGDENTHGCIAFREKNPAPITKTQKEFVSGMQKQINHIISTFVPGFKMATVFEEIGKNETGEALFCPHFYSMKGKAAIPLTAESNGIQKLVSVASAIAQVFANQSTWLILDEFDSGVYEPLLRSLLTSMDEEAKGQMIFTAHNLSVLEVLPHDNIIVTTINPKNRYIRIKNVKRTNNLRDFYLRSILIGGQDEELAPEVDSEEISSSFYDVKDCFNQRHKEA